MDSTTQPPEHNEDDDFPAPPMGTTGMMLTQRQRRRIRDKSKKEAIAKTSVQSKEALQKLLHLRLTEKREVRTGVARNKVRQVVADNNLDVRPGDDVVTIARRMGVKDPALLQQLQSKNFTTDEITKLRDQVAHMDPMALASVLNVLKATS
jgi:hypothetical protein